MTKDQIKERYKQYILPENKEPYHFKKKVLDQEVRAYNPICGDKFKIWFSEEDTIENVYFHGMGCALSKASTSLMIKEVEGKSRQEALAYCKQYLDAVEMGKKSADYSEGLNTLIELMEFEGRKDCIQLSWKAMFNYLNSSEK